MSRAVLISIAVLSFASCERKPAPPPVGEASTAPVKAHVTVLAADILVIDGKHVRLSSAFGPEPVPDARCWAEALAAKQATRTVAAMVDRAASVQAHPTGAVDDYNRALATVTIDGADLGQTLFDEGLAARPAGPRFEWCNPISRNELGAPPLLKMMELAPGPAPGQ